MQTMMALPGRIHPAGLEVQLGAGGVAVGRGDAEHRMIGGEGQQHRACILQRQLIGGLGFPVPHLQRGGCQRHIAAVAFQRIAEMGVRVVGHTAGGQPLHGKAGDF